MDFGTLLSVAQKNENNKQSIACYQTKFSPPKKPTKQSKSLSDNIKKFLARKEEEERQKALEEKKKRENLLALRDHKAQSRINKHLKVCKAANKSVLPDAIDNENTAVTMAGPSQPDEDDYGYVSQEASAFYNQLMSKYNSTTSQKPAFDDCRKRTIKDIASTKDRVKLALKQQKVEEALGHRRKRKHPVKEAELEVEENTEKETKDDKKEKDEKPKAKRKPMPPPIDFTELLKIAEKKQHEPIIIEAKPKSDEPERLLTKKQMKEYAKEKEWRERKEQRNKLGNMNNKEGNVTTSNKLNKTQDCRNNASSSNKISKVSEKLTTVSSISNKTPSKATGLQSSTSKKGGVEKPNLNKVTPNRSNISKTSERDILSEERKRLETERKKLEEMRQAIEEEKKKLRLNKTQIEDMKNPKIEKSVSKMKVEKQELSKNIHKESPAISVTKCRIPKAMNDKIKQFPPADMKSIKSKQMLHLKEQRKLLVNHKRRIRDEDDEEEYDSELEDFIDDDVEEGNEDYSKYISEIFGYDKNKYKYVDNDDDTAMESSFAQQLKEEYVSTKIGIMEDLEDMRMEALEKKRKALFKKKFKK
ncbi:protein SPT2 homolog [Bombus vosnesenskii]|uniref:Protein SPT2 homolog n=1 Tax=Bombus vosnesenskii TaxID=207650 RepID=A0A6J3KL45_9HYME|nr:protein SPT2 homolog [Bombus vosnesenskii]